MRRFRFPLGAAVIAAGLFYLLVTGFQQTAATHMTLDQLQERIARDRLDTDRIQLGGSTVLPGSIQWDEYHSRPEFTITDGRRTLAVRYTGNAVLPDSFRDEALVVLEGHYDPAHQRFEAQMVMAKCPSKYEGQDYEGHLKAMGEG